MHQLFNVCFTGLPIIWYAIYDRAYPKEKFLSKTQYAKKYLIGIDNIHFTTEIFWLWMLKGVGEAYLTVISITSIQGLDPSNINGKMVDHWVAGMACFMAVIFCANATIVAMTHNHTCEGTFFIFASAFSYFPIAFILA